MSSPSERTSLTAHVDLCALRYNALESRLKRLEWLIYAILVVLAGSSEPAAHLLKVLLK